jgi:hypothetical protein
LLVEVLVDTPQLAGSVEVVVPEVYGYFQTLRSQLVLILLLLVPVVELSLMQFRMLVEVIAEMVELGMHQQQALCITSVLIHILLKIGLFVVKIRLLLVLLLMVVAREQVIMVCIWAAELEVVVAVPKGMMFMVDKILWGIIYGQVLMEQEQGFLMVVRVEMEKVLVGIEPAVEEELLEQVLPVHLA